MLHNTLRPPYHDGFETIVLGTGCYWGAEKGFWRLPGVYTTAVGYCGGTTKNPTSDEIATGLTGHAEAVKVVWNPMRISISDILRQFWESHNPSQPDGQGTSIGNQYRSAIYAYSPEHLLVAEASKVAYQEALGRQIFTEIKSAQEAGPFYYASNQHQQYLARPGSRQECTAEPQGVSLPPFEEWAPKGMEHLAPKLGPDFWAEHAPTPHCVLHSSNEQIRYEVEGVFLPGRDEQEELSNIHLILKTNLRGPFPNHLHQIVIATGCYWGSEKGFWRFPGVFSTAVGYCGGVTKNPSYAEVCTGLTGHTEAVNVVWDPAVASTSDILRQFWESHNPAQRNGQGEDVGTQYRSAIYYFTPEQGQLAHASKDAYERALSQKIWTEIRPIEEAGPFFYAHEAYQQYLARKGSRNYCSAEPQGVSLPPFEEWAPKELSGHKPLLPASFWEVHAPTPHCVLRLPNEPIEL